MFIYGLQSCQGKNRDFVSVDLERTHAKVIVQGFVGHLSTTLVYRNRSKESLEVTYVCPVDANAAVYHFEAKIENRKITGHCLEKEKAQELYKNAVEQGCTAILGTPDELSSDVIHLSLGNIPAGQTMELHLKLVMELPVNVDGSVTFTLPTVFNPRYCPANEKSGPTFLPSVLPHQVFPNRTKYSLEVEGEVRGSLKISRITSATDPINVRLGDEKTSALITQDGGSDFSHDWNIQVYYETVHKAQALLMAGNRSCEGLMKDDILMLNLFPEIPEESFSPHNELIFVVDRSGSMGGNKIIQARKTLLLLLKSLPTGCRFNILSFGSSCTSLFESSSERYTEETLETALQLQKSMEANMGGTEIFRALQHAYSKDLIPGYARQMIVLTDGEVWNQEAIFELISRHADETRIFSVGIGDGASTALVRGMADAGRGRHEMVLHDNQLQMKVMGLVASMLQENVRDLKVECEVDPSQALLLVPKIRPVIFGGQHLIMYARVTPKSEIKSLKILWKVGDQGLKCDIGSKDCRVIHDSNFSFHRLAAKAQLRQWERDFERTQEDLIGLSVSSNVVCKATSFVGIDQDGKFLKEIELDSDLFESNQNLHLCSAKLKSEKKWSMPGMRANFLRKFCSFSRDCPDSGRRACPDSGIRARSACALSLGARTRMSNASVQNKEKEPSDDLIVIASSQKFDGSWSLDDAIAFLDASEDRMKDIQSQLSLDDNCFATVLILTILEKEFSIRKQEWKLLSIKGRAYLTSNNVDVIKVMEIFSRQLISFAIKYVNKTS